MDRRDQKTGKKTTAQGERTGEGMVCRQVGLDLGGWLQTSSEV